MVIAICDDDITIIEELKKYILSYYFKFNREVDLLSFTTAYDLLNAPYSYDVLFIDIKLDHNNDGINIGKLLRDQGCNALFIIISACANRAIDAYEATVFRFILKPFKEKDIHKALASANMYFERSNRVLAVKYYQQIDYVDINDIILIESYMRKRYVYTNTRKYHTTEKWSSLLEKVEDVKCFYKIQKSYLINFHHMKSNTKSHVIMDNGKEISLRKGAYKDFQMALNDYLGEFK